MNFCTASLPSNNGQSPITADHLPRDLEEKIAEARRRVGDARAIWCRPSLAYATRVEYSHGLVLGGAHSPLFLSSAHPLDPVTRRVPAGLMAARVRVVVTGGAFGPIEEWLPFLEAVQEAGESLVIVTPLPPPPEALETLVVNTQRRTLVACAVHPSGHDLDVLRGDEDGRHAHSGARIEAGPPEPGMREELPLFECAMIRRDACVLLEGPEEARTDALAVIHVGGADVEDVEMRLAAAARAVERMRLEFPTS